MINPKVAVVILSWNDSKNTIDCLKTVLKNNYSNFDIILIDNNSDYFHFDKLLNWCNKNNIIFEAINFQSKFSNKKRIRKKLYIYRINEVANFPFAKNLGVARGYNKGLNYALKKNYDFFIRLDCDFLVPKNFIHSLIKTFENYPKAVAVSPKVYYYLNKKTKLIWWTHLNFTKNYFRFHKTGKGNNRRVLDKGQFKGIINSDSICGCCVMFKTKAVKSALKNYPSRTNVLDEEFFFGPEDMEISHRLKKHGEILVNLDHYAHHKVSQSIHVSGIKSHIYFATIGWLLITKKICNKQDQLITRIFFLFRGFLHLIKLIYKTDKDHHLGFLLGLKDYFLKY